MGSHRRTSPIEAFLAGRLREDEFLAAVDRTIAEGTDTDRTVLAFDWRTKSGRIRRAETRHQLDQRLRHLAWSESPGCNLVASNPPHVGEILAGRFIIESELGAGGMGTVFKALDLRRKEAQDRNPYVAVKTLNLKALRRADSIQILQREARKAQSLSHPNIVRIFDFDRAGEVLFLTMEFLDGISLETLIQNNIRPGMPMASLLPIIEQIVSALQFAHGEGIVHSDLKPSNIIVLSNGRVKVIDFGIARAIPKHDELTADRTRFDVRALGAITPAYASPEMIDGNDPDPRDDVFALACIVYECLTGRHPFGRMPASIARAGNFQPPRPAGMASPQWRAILNGLQFDRSCRTSSPARFLSELVGETRRTTTGRLVLYAGTVAVVAAVLAVGMKGTVEVTEYPSGSGRAVTYVPPMPSEEPRLATHDERRRATEAAPRLALQKTAHDGGLQLAEQVVADEAAQKFTQQKAALDQISIASNKPAGLIQTKPPNGPAPPATTDIRFLQKARTCSGMVPEIDLRYARFATPQATIRMSNDGGWCWAEFSVSPSTGFGFSQASSVGGHTLRVAPDTDMIAPPAHGTVLMGAVNGQSRLAYRPSSGFTGADEFRVKFFDVVNAMGTPMIVKVTVAAP
jgi:serine/threonine protein kinase